MTRLAGQKRRVERRGECLHCAKDIEEAQHGGAGLTLPAGPLAKSEDRDAQVVGGAGFIKAQAVHEVGELVRGWHGFSRVRKTRQGRWRVGLRGQGSEVIHQGQQASGADCG